MSGHSKWANIKNRKGAQDKKRSEAFTRTAKDILTAVRSSGGNTNPESNVKLKTAIEKAREVNMPRENIERLLTRFEERKANLVGLVLEGYAVGGVPVIIEAETDNKNRTLGEIKLIFRDNECSLGEANSVAFMFERMGEITVAELSEDQELDLIDAGATDFGEKIIYCRPEELDKVSKGVEEKGMMVSGAQLIMRCQQPVLLRDEDEVAKVMDLVEELEEHDDVINVFVGMDYHG